MTVLASMVAPSHCIYMRYRLKVIFFCLCKTNVCSTFCWKVWPFLAELPLSKSVVYVCVDSFLYSLFCSTDLFVPIPISCWLITVAYNNSWYLIGQVSLLEGFPGGSEIKPLPAVQETIYNAGDADSTPGLGRLPREGNGNPFQYSRLGNPMDRGAWQATVHGITRVRHNLVTK